MDEERKEELDDEERKNKFPEEKKDSSAPTDKVGEEEENASELINKANDAAGRLEAANITLGELLSKQERMKVEKTLGGETVAGTQEKSKDEKADDEARKFLKGTGFEDDLFPEKKE